MTYATRTDLDLQPWADEIPALADRDNSGAEDAGVVTNALSWADHVINSRIAGRVALPLATVPPRLVDIACVLARYWLWGAQRTEQVRQDYADAIGELNDFVAGKTTLGLDANGTDTVAPERTISVTGSTPIFSRGEGW